MFKELYEVAILLIFRPSEAWKKLNDEQSEDNEKFLSRFVYPFIGLMALAAFLGVLFSYRKFDLQLALKSSVLSLMSSLGGFFLISYLLNEACVKFFDREKDFKLCQRFIGYSSVVIFVVNIVLNLFPEFFFFKIGMLYTLYTVWEGALVYMKIIEKEQLKFSLIATALIVFVPVLLEAVFRMAMPGLRI